MHGRWRISHMIKHGLIIAVHNILKVLFFGVLLFDIDLENEVQILFCKLTKLWLESCISW